MQKDDIHTLKILRYMSEFGGLGKHQSNPAWTTSVRMFRMLNLATVLKKKRRNPCSGGYCQRVSCMPIRVSSSCRLLITIIAQAGVLGESSCPLHLLPRAVASGLQGSPLASESPSAWGCGTSAGCATHAPLTGRKNPRPGLLICLFLLPLLFFCRELCRKR